MTTLSKTDFQLLTHALNEAGDFLRAKKYQFAVSGYEKILSQHTDQPDALHGLGLAMKETGETDRAEELIRRAIYLFPTLEKFHFNLCVLLDEKGKPDEAIEACQAAIRLKPDYVKANLQLGCILYKQMRLNEAANYYNTVIRIAPECGQAYIELGALLGKKGLPKESIRYIKEGLRVSPNSQSGYNNLGVAYHRINEPDESIKQYKKALELNPKDFIALRNISGPLREMLRLEEAEEYLTKSILLKPDYADALNDLGLIYAAKGLRDEAEKKYYEALYIEPGLPIAHHNLAFLALSGGDLEKGWENYEWRIKAVAGLEFRETHFAAPRWDGVPEKGKTLLIWGEQGIGDELMFGSITPDVLKDVDKVVIECDKRLATLFGRSYPDVLIYGAERKSDFYDPVSSMPEYDVQIPIGSLAQYYRNDLESFPTENAYLIPDSEQVDSWQNRLDNLGSEPKVGIIWRGGLRTPLRDLCYTEMTQLEPILTVPGIQFINLQYDECSEELQYARDTWGVEIHNWKDFDQYNDIDGVAALISALDLVITVGTTVQAIASGVGKPVWKIGQRKNIWMHGTDHVPWYPSMRVFEQHESGTWEPTIEEIARALQERYGYEK